jgi:hypothetical protein
MKTCRIVLVPEVYVKGKEITPNKLSYTPLAPVSPPLLPPPWLTTFGGNNFLILSILKLCSHIRPGPVTVVWQRPCAIQKD